MPSQENQTKRKTNKNVLKGFGYDMSVNDNVKVNVKSKRTIKTMEIKITQLVFCKELFGEHTHQMT